MRIHTFIGALLVTAAVPAVASGAMHPELGAKLLGKAEVPKGAPAGHGIVNLDLKAAKGQVCWTFGGLVGIDKPAAAHIHRAPPGKAGPIVVPLGGAFEAKGCTTAPKQLIEAIEGNPGAFYVNVHTAKYPNGAVRGQLVAGMVHL